MSAEVCHRFKSEDGGEVLIAVRCPACGYSHPFRIQGDGPTWTWNGDMVRPTFAPSMMVNKSHPASQCHSYVTDGNIKFENDCWHTMKGQTVPLEPWAE